MKLIIVRFSYSVEGNNTTRNVKQLETIITKLCNVCKVSPAFLYYFDIYFVFPFL